MEETYKYFAFISFQSSDAKQALWVQKQIENYRLPTTIQRINKTLPKRMRPCFCYLNDISLSEELMQELKLRMWQSEYLIVICSPRSAKSQFVNGGIDYFVSLGRRERIIPLIVEGTPYSSDSSTECFPEALRRHFPKSADPMQDHQILGVNLNEEGAGSKSWRRHRALLMVVARMLNLEFNNLWNREVQRLRRKRIMISVVVLLVAALLTMTWYMSRSVNIETVWTEAEPVNSNLPQSTDGKLVLSLHNEEKTVNNIVAGENVIFKNVPNRFLGQKVRVSFTCSNYLPVDTTVRLTKQMSLPLRRDRDVYGKVRVMLKTNRKVRKGEIDRKSVV